MNKQNIQGFDILKSIAATLIVFHHYQQVFKVEFSPINFYGGGLNYGYFVELFFIISGFLAFYSTRGGTAEELVRKLLRIYPMTTIACAFTLAVKSVAAENLGLLWNWKALSANFLLIFSGWPFFEMIGYNNPTWYLCELIQCYLLFYTIRWISKKVNVKRAWFDAAVIVAAFGLHHFCYFPYNAYRGIEAFSIGLLLCELKDKIPQKRWIAIILCAFSIAAIIVFPSQQRRIMTFITFPAIVMLVVWRNKGAKHFIISTFGKVTFEVFIWHYPLMAVEKMVTRVFGFEFSRTYLSMFTFTIGIWLIAYLLYRYVEMPINRKIGKRATC